MKKIAILLATFNGAKYIRRLIDSICQQSYGNFLLYIHDDGSSDDTLKTICEYEDDRIIILNDSSCKRGAKGSFIWLLEQVDAEYYMFCDQDDLWLPFKIEQSLNFIQVVEKNNPGKPVCIHTDLAVADANYNVVSKSLWRQSKIKPGLLEDKNYIQVFNCVTGCTMMFNQKAKECALPFNEIAPMHDFWVAYQTMTHDGVLTHLPVSTMLYCQHGNNTIGANEVGANYVKDKLLHSSQVFKGNIINYKKMHAISGITFFNYMKCKLLYEFFRLL